MCQGGCIQYRRLCPTEELPCTQELRIQYTIRTNTYGHNLTQLSASAANLPLRSKRFCVRPLWAGEARQPTLVRHDQPQGVLQVLYLHLVRPGRTYVVNTAAHQGSARTATSRHDQRQRMLGAAPRIDQPLVWWERLAGQRALFPT